MNDAIKEFARIGAALLALVAKLALQTKGAFPAGAASTTLALGIAYSEAARNAFMALGHDDTLPPEERVRLLEAGAYFRQALGIIATRMPGPQGGAVVSSLVGFSQPGGSISGYFASNAAPPVSVSAAAKDALDALRRDPLALAAEGRVPILLLMDAVADGVVVNP